MFSQQSGDTRQVNPPLRCQESKSPSSLPPSSPTGSAQMSPPVEAHSDPLFKIAPHHPGTFVLSSFIFLYRCYLFPACVSREVSAFVCLIGGFGLSAGNSTWHRVGAR